MSTHPEPPDEYCHFRQCEDMATHKVGEEGTFYLHNMTTYLCCWHMKAMRMDCEHYPYEAAMTPPPQMQKWAQQFFDGEFDMPTPKFVKAPEPEDG